MRVIIKLLKILLGKAVNEKHPHAPKPKKSEVSGTGVSKNI